MSDIATWSPAAADNDVPTPNGWPEGQTAGSVNDCGREMMAALRRQHEQAEWIDFGHVPNRVDGDTFTLSTDLTTIYHAGRKVRLGGSATAYGTIASSSYSAPTTTVNLTASVNPATLSAVAAGLTSAINTSAPTTGSELAAQSAEAAAVAAAASAASVAPITGSFTGTITGVTGTVTAEITYRVVGGLCMLSVADSATHTGTSNSAAMTMTGAPVAARPSFFRKCVTACRNPSGLTFTDAFATIDTSGLITFSLTDGSSFSSSGSPKGLDAGWTMSYPL